MNRKNLLLLLTVLSLMWTGSLFAAAPEACQNAIRQQVLENNPKAGDIVFHREQETEKTLSSSEMLHEGKGQFQRESGEREHFTWQCTHNPRTGTISEAKYSVTSDAPLAQDKMDSCHDAIRDRIHEENQGSGAVTFLSSRPSRMTDNQNLLEGTGHVVIKGKDTNFKYRCIFNPTGNLTQKTYEIQ